MFDPLNGSPPAQPGRLHSFTVSGGLRAEPDEAELHNGMAFSGDGKTFYLSHSKRGEITFDYEASSGALSNRRVFATVPAKSGFPDGAAIDTDGGYWSALHGGGNCAAFIPTAPWIAMSSFLSASPLCPPSPAKAFGRSTSPALPME